MTIESILESAHALISTYQSKVGSLVSLLSDVRVAAADAGIKLNIPETGNGTQMQARLQVEDLKGGVILGSQQNAPARAIDGKMVKIA